MTDFSGFALAHCGAGRAARQRRGSGPVSGSAHQPAGSGEAIMGFGLKAMKAALLRRVLAKYRHLSVEFGDHGYLEPIYQHLFLRELARYGLEDEYTPVQSAANYSLLFMLLKSVVLGQPAEILELGCGETTLLLDALRRSGAWRGNLTSLEQDSFWHKEISALVATDVIHAPLTKRTINGIETPAYDLSALARPLGLFDFVLVDGPNGAPRWSRLACLDFIPDHLARDFLIILDDYERRGEKETAALLRDSLAAKGLEVSEESILSNKHQLMLATEAYRPCLYPRFRRVDAAKRRPGMRNSSEQLAAPIN
jgi:hypothetical protein